MARPCFVAAQDPGAKEAVAAIFDSGACAAQPDNTAVRHKAASMHENTKTTMR